MQETHFLSTSNPKPFSSNLIPLPNPNPKSQFQSSSSSHHDPSFHSHKTPPFPNLSTKTKTPSPIKPQTPPPPSDFHDKALYLDSIGLDLFSLLHHHPPILSASLADLKSTVHFLLSTGFSTLELRRLVGMCPEILASRVSDIIPIFTFLLREARVNGSDLKRVINRRPRLLASSVKHRLRPTLYFLQSIGIADVNKHTSLLSCSVEDKLQPRVDYLEKIGFSHRDALAMFRRFPQLFCYGIEQNLEPKFNYFVVEMGRELKELKEFPHYFSFSLEKRIRPRHQRCVDKGVCFPLPVLLKTSEAKFRERLEEHPSLTKAERKRICGLMDVKKLTMEASMDAAQNERLPLRVVVQVLFFEQVRSSAASRSLNNHPSDGSQSTTNLDEEYEKTAEEDYKPLGKQLRQMKVSEELQKNGKLGKKDNKNSRSGAQLLPSRSRRVFDKLWSVGKGGHGENKSSETSGSSQSPTSIVPDDSKSVSSRRRRHSIS